MKTVRHKPITDKPFLNWIDTTTPKGESIVENLFGESIQLHTTHTLGDMCVDRPMIVKYDYWFNYFVEAVVVLLFFLGIFFGVSSGSKFYWMCLKPGSVSTCFCTWCWALVSTRCISWGLTGSSSSPSPWPICSAA